MSDWSSDVCSSVSLCEVVPIENAAMAERTVIEWDKDDLDALGILKVDVLALGMLTCLRKGFELMRQHYGRDLTIASVPPEDPAVYEMLQRADSIGVFQVESRAQMSMLPRLRSEEHTSELQSLMRISYAVFCLTKKKPQ